MGEYPTSFWDKGEIVRDEHPLTIPSDIPSGDYSLTVGMYDVHTTKRLDLIAEDGRPQDGTIPLLTVRVVDGR